MKIKETHHHLNLSSNDVFIMLLAVIGREAWDNRNLVKKAANRVLRQIGKKWRFKVRCYCLRQ